MQVSFILLQQIIMFFIMMLMGMAVVLSGLLKSEDSKVLSIIAVYLVLPCVIVHSFQIELSKEVVSSIVFAFVMAIATHIFFILCVHIAGRFWEYSDVEKVTIIYSNAGNMIIPIITTLLGEKWIVFSSAYIAVQLIFLWTHGNQLISNSKTFIWKKLFQNINLIAICLGLIMFLLNIRLPNTINSTLGSVGALLAPLGMFITGMLIVKVDFKKTFKNRRIYHVCLMRLIVYPGILLIVFCLTGIPNIIANGSILMLITFMATITPASSTIIQMTQIYGKDATYASSLNCVTTVFCIITMPVMVMIYCNIYQLF